MIPVRDQRKDRVSNETISDGPFDIAHGSSRAMPRDERFRKYEHILKAKDFRKTYKKGAYFKRDAVILYVLSNGLENSRIGFSISSRYLKLASARNRLRRRLREIYRKKKRFLKQGFDIIFIAGKGVSKIDRYKKLDEIVCELLKKAGMFV